jgi:predicted esterase
MLQTKHTTNIGNFIKGYLEYRPPDYNTTNGHPLIIYFHGAGEVGNGSLNSLCNLLTAPNLADIPLPERIEMPGFNPNVTFNGTNYSYIIVSPQYDHYNYPTDYPQGGEVEAMIDFLVNLYGTKIDRNRIYLTGMSTGANMIVDYAATSLARARRIAAIFPVALCIIVPPYGTSNIANANLPYWGVHCPADPSGCDFAFHQNWVNAINGNMPPPNPLAQLTTVAGCNAHNVWNDAYLPSYTPNGINFYNWLVQFSASAALPAKLTNYSARLDRGRAIIEWTTSNESNTASFMVERAGPSQPYEVIGQIPAAGISSTEKKYSIVDELPKPGANFYRLALVNADGNKEYFEVKKLNIPIHWSGKINIPNPAKGTLDIYINLDKKERIQIQVFDLNGRLMKEVKKEFNPGLTENKIDVSSLSHGTYLIRVTGETISVNKKIIVN